MCEYSSNLTHVFCNIVLGISSLRGNGKDCLTSGKQTIKYFLRIVGQWKYVMQ